MESPEPLFNAKAEANNQSKAAPRGLGSFEKRAETANRRGRRTGRDGGPRGGCVAGNPGRGGGGGEAGALNREKGT